MMDLKAYGYTEISCSPLEQANEKKTEVGRDDY